MDVPFFRHVAERPDGDLEVIYTRAERIPDRFYDPELGRVVSWGMQLWEGYPYSVLPRRRQAAWLLHELRRQSYDMVVVNGYHERGLITAAFAGKVAHSSLALRLDTPSFRSERRAKRAVRRGFYAGLRLTFDHFLPVGLSAADFLARMGIPRGEMSLFPYTVDLDHFRRSSKVDPDARRNLRRKYGLPIGELVAVSVTKFHPRESPWDLLRAYCSMDSPDAYLWLVGDGPERPALEEYARQHCPGRVAFGGYVPYEDLPTAYGIADAFVHPARFEPWGVSVQEALACGLPVLASSRVGAARDFVTPGKNGFIYGVGDTEELRRLFPRLLALVSSPEARRVSAENLARCEYSHIWAMLSKLARLNAPRRSAQEPSADLR
jgi:glycosyltransferase involved in cell wall biosynthesis